MADQTLTKLQLSNLYELLELSSPFNYKQFLKAYAHKYPDKEFDLKIYVDKELSHKDYVINSTELKHHSSYELKEMFITCFYSRLMIVEDADIWLRQFNYMQHEKKGNQLLDFKKKTYKYLNSFTINNIDLFPALVKNGTVDFLSYFLKKHPQKIEPEFGLDLAKNYLQGSQSSKTIKNTLFVLSFCPLNKKIIPYLENVVSIYNNPILNNQAIELFNKIDDNTKNSSFLFKKRDFFSDEDQLMYEYKFKLDISLLIKEKNMKITEVQIKSMWFLNYIKKQIEAKYNIRSPSDGQDGYLIYSSPDQKKINNVKSEFTIYKDHFNIVVDVLANSTHDTLMKFLQDFPTYIKIQNQLNSIETSSIKKNKI